MPAGSFNPNPNPNPNRNPNPNPNPNHKGGALCQLGVCICCVQAEAQGTVEA